MHKSVVRRRLLRWPLRRAAQSTAGVGQHAANRPMHAKQRVSCKKKKIKLVAFCERTNAPSPKVDHLPSTLRPLSTTTTLSKQQQQTMMMRRRWTTTVRTGEPGDATRRAAERRQAPRAQLVPNALQASFAVAVLKRSHNKNGLFIVLRYLRFEHIYRV